MQYKGYKGRTRLRRFESAEKRERDREMYRDVKERERHVGESERDARGMIHLMGAGKAGEPRLIRR